MTQYFGKYRGKVVDNDDPQRRGRIRVSVPAVTGDSTPLAEPSLPFAGNGVGLWAIPPVGANVWVEYEGGDPEHPIWSGCFWDVGEAPAKPAAAQAIVLKTQACTLTLSDLPEGGITIETATGMKIAMSATGLEITNGQGATIQLLGPRVTVNKDALEVV